IWIDKFGHYDGSNLYDDTNFGVVFGVIGSSNAWVTSCVLDFADYNNELYAATEEPAILFGSTDGITWSAVSNCPMTNYYAMWQLEPFQGQLYLGYGTNCTYPNNPQLTGLPGGLLAYMDSSISAHK